MLRWLTMLRPWPDPVSLDLDPADEQAVAAALRPAHALSEHRRRAMRSDTLAAFRASFPPAPAEPSDERPARPAGDDGQVGGGMNVVRAEAFGVDAVLADVERIDADRATAALSKLSALREMRLLEEPVEQLGDDQPQP